MVLAGAPRRRSCWERLTLIGGRFAVSVCYVRHHRDGDPTIRARAAQLGVDYMEIQQRGPIDVCRLARTAPPGCGSATFEIVHAHDYKTDLLGILLARSDRVIPLATAHGWTGHSRRERSFYYPADRRLLARYPLVIAVSSEIRDKLVRSGARPERVRTILNGIDHRLFRRRPEDVPAARGQLWPCP